MFTPIDMAISGHQYFISIPPTLLQCLKDWRCLIQCMAKTPTSVLQLIVSAPTYISYTDACRLGAGAVWCSGTKCLKLFLWQVEWPQDIQDNLVTAENPNRKTTINDLELAGALLGFLALEEKGLPLTYTHLDTFCDNITTVAWAYKLLMSKSQISGYLFWFLGLRIHQAQASSMILNHLAGVLNIMEDIILRAFKRGQLFVASQHGLVPYFNEHSPLTQNKSGTECHMLKDQVSCVIACLCGKLQPMESRLRQTPSTRNNGITGQTTQHPHASTHSLIIQFLPTKMKLLQEHLLLGSGQEATDKEIRSKFQASWMLSQPSPRPLQWLDNTFRSTGRTRNTSCSSSGS